ncbi:MAG TPA: FecR family protein [Flavisolibacter sp.]|nr:FecR family protein [Flavisolibacter sp.]
MHQERFWNLLAKKLAGEATEDEKNELFEIIKANPDLSYEAQHIADLWKLKTSEQNAASEKAFQNLLSRIEAQKANDTGFSENAPAEINGEPVKKRKWQLPVFLLLFGLLLVAGFLVWKNEGKKTPLVSNQHTQEIYTRPGTRTKLVLPDSSTVWLNAGSKLTYAQPFGVSNRVVTLTGEAFFDVVKNSKPFIIHTNGAQVKVLGTAFNVRSYPSEKKIETSLVRGQVEVSLDNSPESKYTLNPNQKLTLNTADQKTVKTGRKGTVKPIAVLSTLNYLDDNTIAETSWVENKLTFDDESFEEVARKMERWYGVTIHFKNEKVKAERLTGVFEKETVGQALRALQETAPFHFAINNNIITITH